jgi:hypothetical protein
MLITRPHEPCTCSRSKACRWCCLLYYAHVENDAMHISQHHSCEHMRLSGRARAAVERRAAQIPRRTRCQTEEFEQWPGPGPSRFSPPASESLLIITYGVHLTIDAAASIEWLHRGLRRHTSRRHHPRDPARPLHTAAAVPSSISGDGRQRGPGLAPALALVAAAAAAVLADNDIVRGQR